MNPFPDSGPPRPIENDAEAQYAALRRLLHATAVSVLILAGTLFVFLYRQVVLVRRQTADLSRYINEVDNSGMSNFVERVHVKFDEFRKTHPDFNPIYNKYWPGQAGEAKIGASPQEPGVAVVGGTNR
jgi:hypothetical protein